uniref:Uncharacterized protein n=1 Tax=Panagrolaimus sp. PS1159 TaxID=55785 RepID=A0AC35EY27_9BILA
MNNWGAIKVGGSYFAAISALDESFLITVVDSETEKVVMQCPMEMMFIKTVKDFVNFIPKFFTNFKAVILHLFYFQTSEYSNMVEFRKELKEKLDAIKKPNHFMEEEECFLSYLINSNIVKVNRGERFVYISNCEEDEICVSEYQLTANGYKKGEERRMGGMKSKNDSTISQVIYGPNNPKRIILPKDKLNPSAFKRLQSICSKEKNVTIFEMSEIFPKTIVDAGKWILNGKNQSQRPIIPFCVQTCSMGYECPDGTYVPLTTIEAVETLPITKNFYTSKFLNELVVFLHDAHDNPVVTLATIPTVSDCHRNRFIFTVNKENFPIYNVQRSIINEICDLPTKLNNALKSKIPVIGFCDNFSIISVYKEDIKCYKCLDEWNGLFGKDFCVSFDREKPEFCEKAKEKLESKRTSVVFDLLQIMSQKPENIKICEFWGFTITKDDENPVLIEFDNFDGTKKVASPAFLVAFLLKEHIKAIKKETGKKPEKLGFWSFDEYNKEEKMRIQKGLEEACKLLKIQCIFVEV